MYGFEMMKTASHNLKQGTVYVTLGRMANVGSGGASPRRFSGAYAPERVV